MVHVPLPPFSAVSGAKRPKLVLLGEAWGGNEADIRKPFVGEAGKELWRMLGEAMPGVEPELHAEICGLHRYGLAWTKPREAWLEAAGIAMTNVLAFRPPDNNLEALCGAKKEVGGQDYILPTMTKGKYLRPEFLPELSRLQIELAAWKPNLVVALGNTACWALLQATNIGSIRGAVVGARLDGPGTGVKCLPSYHPAGVLRNWSWRPIVVADLMKAARECQFPEIRRPSRSILIDPSIEELEAWTAQTLANPPAMLSPDIETEGGQIKCIGFARSRTEAIVVPFVDKAKPGWSYWPDQSTELRAWKAVRALLESPIVKVGQNFIYDLQYIVPLTIRPKSLLEDTMLLHHSLFPELQKGLGFLGSIYTNEAAWKLMRRQKADTEKRDE